MNKDQYYEEESSNLSDTNEESGIFFSTQENKSNLDKKLDNDIIDNISCSIWSNNEVNFDTIEIEENFNNKKIVQLDNHNLFDKTHVDCESFFNKNKFLLNYEQDELEVTKRRKKDFEIGEENKLFDKIKSKYGEKFFYKLENPHTIVFMDDYTENKKNFMYNFLESKLNAMLKEEENVTFSDLKNERSFFAGQYENFFFRKL